MLRTIRRGIDRSLLLDSAYMFLFEPDQSGEVVSLDCETNGFNAFVDDVVSIAAIKIRDSRLLTSQAFQAVLRQDSAMDVSAIKVHRLREKDVAGGRTIYEVLPEFLRFIGSRPLVGYWVSFDVRMLNKYLLSMLNIHLPNRLIDVSKLYYERKYGSAPPGTPIDLRYASILADLGLRAPAARRLQRRVGGGRDVHDFARHASTRRPHPASDRAGIGERFSRGVK
jgi:DNA polymerase III subunit epsilon